MAAQDYISVVQQLYVSYFGRPADYYGLKNFTEQLAAIDTAGTLTDFKALTAAANAASPTSPLGNLINSFNGSPEAAALYGTDNTEIGISKFVAAVYQNVLGREADVEGLAFWVNAIKTGVLTRANAAVAITEGAMSNTSAQGLLDAQTVANKNTVATNFTAAIDTTAEINGYSGDAAAATAREMLGLVNNTTNTTTFQATVESTLSNIVDGVDAGTIFTLTTGIDSITGTTKDDVIKALVDDAGADPDVSTLSPLDTINGGTGVDTLEINALTALGTVSGVTVSGVENVSIRAASTVNANFSTWTGVEELTITEAVGAVTLTAAATTNVTSAQKVGTGDATTTINGGKNVVVSQTEVDSTNDDIVVGNTTAAAGTVSVTSTGKAAVHGTNLTLGDIAVTGGSSIKVTQSAGSTAGLSVGAAATHTQGNVSITGNASTTSVESYQTAKATAKAGVAGVTAVAETASVKFAAMTAGQTLVAGGLTFTAAKDLTAAEVAKTFAGLIKGTLPAAGDSQAGGIVANGVYTGNFTGWTSAAANGDTVVFTSTGSGNVADLAFTGTATAPVVTTTNGVAKVTAVTPVLGVANGTVSVTDAAGTIKTITVDGYSTGSTTTTSVLETLNLSNGGNFVVADSAATLALNLSKVGSSTVDAALTITAAPTTLNVKSTGNTYVDLDANLTETLNVSGTGVFKADTVALGALKTVVVKETAGVTLDATAANTLVTVDTTATTGTSTVSIDASKATFTGGAGVDVVTTTTTTVAKAINTGSGNDEVILASGTTSIGAGSITGGAGTDTLSMVAADAVVASGSTAFAGKVTAFEALEVTGATGAQEIETDVLGNYNDVEISSAAGGHVLTLDGMSSGATIRLGDNTNNSTIVKIKNASTGTADVANVILTDDSDDGVADSKGTVTFADVETVNITTVEGDGADTQNLTLVATKATTIKAVGDIALNLTNTGNTAVTLIDGSTMTAGLTVQAAGTVATTIKGGSGNDVLTASGGASGGAAQVSTIVLTDGTNTGLDDNDTMSVNVGGTTFTYTASGVETMDTAGAALAALIDANAAYGATYNAGTNTIEVTAAVAGTPFSLASYAVTDVANDVNKTATAAVITETQATVQEKHTVAVTADGVDDGDEVSTVTYDNDGSAGAGTGTVAVTFGAVDVTVKANVTNAIVAALNADGGFSALATASNVGDDVVVTYKGNDAYDTVAIANTAGTTNTLAYAPADTANGTLETTTVVVTGTITGAMTAGDTVSITVDADGAGAGAAVVYTYTAAAGDTLDVAAAGLAALVNAAAGVDAAYNAGTDTITITDAISADANGFTVSAYTVTDVAETNNATGSSAVFATGTGNVTPTGDTLLGGAGADTLVSGTAMSTLTGGDGQDMFVVGGASSNVNSYSTITDFTASDLIQFSGAIAFKSAAVSLGGTAVFQDYANAAINALQDNEVGWFQFGGDTYIVMDVAGGTAGSFTNGNDKIVKLTGAVNLANASFNETHDTIALV